MPEFKQAVRELALAGITKDELIQAVNDVFKEM
jgi:hypothetical protein